MPETKKKIYHNAINKYNQKTYDTISIRVPKETAEQFKEKCAERGVSQAQVIKAAIQSFLEQ